MGGAEGRSYFGVAAGVADVMDVADVIDVGGVGVVVDVAVAAVFAVVADVVVAAAVSVAAALSFFIFPKYIVQFINIFTYFVIIIRIFQKSVDAKLCMHPLKNVLRQQQIHRHI